MNATVARYIERITEERNRQIDLPGSEWDSKNSPGDWIAIVGHYLHDEVRYKGMKPTKENFEDSLIKASAVILAALEHVDRMQEHGQLE